MAAEKTRVVFANRHQGPNGDTYSQGRWYDLEPREARELVARGKVRVYDKDRDKDVKRGQRGADPAPVPAQSSTDTTRAPRDEK